MADEISAVPAFATAWARHRVGTPRRRSRRSTTPSMGQDGWTTSRPTPPRARPASPSTSRCPLSDADGLPGCSSPPGRTDRGRGCVGGGRPGSHHPGIGDRGRHGGDSPRRDAAGRSTGEEGGRRSNLAEPGRTRRVRARHAPGRRPADLHGGQSRRSSGYCIDGSDMGRTEADPPGDSRPRRGAARRLDMTSQRTCR